MRRIAALAILGVGGLLLTPGAAGGPEVPGDPTPPVVTPVIFGTPGSNGWYTTNVTVNWSITDPESVILSTSGCNATTFTTDTTGIQLTCSATSDGGTTTVSKTFKIDKTIPVVTSKTPSRPPDANGWYNQTLTITFGGTDATSGIDTCTEVSYSGPDSADASVPGTCRDKAGNQSAQSSFGFKYDDTAPSNLGGSLSRSPDSNGWYNQTLTVTFAGTADVTSPPTTCTQVNYSGPDGAQATVSGTCRDQAGNVSGSSSVQFKYDDTAPSNSGGSASRSPDFNGWYNQALTVTFQGNDVTSPPTVCTQTNYSGPDSPSASVPGSCRDQAGNQSTQSNFGFKYDDTAPSNLGGSASRSPDVNGWYNNTLTVTFAGSDVTSPPTACTQVNYSGPDSGTASVPGSCRDQAGNQSTQSNFGFKYDATGPALTPAARAPDANGWYNHALPVSFPGADTVSGIVSCTPQQTYSSPDRANAALTGSCTNHAGLTTTRTLTFNYDATPPALTPAARAPDANGWYNHALTVSFPGTDATSGIDVCTNPQTYSGPDKTNAAFTGSCTDKAGHNTTRTFLFQYDGSKPQITAVIPSRPPNADGWYKEPLSVEFRGSDVMSGIAGCAHPTYSGPESATASVSGTCLDKAGNESLPSSHGFKYDSTGPAVIPTPTRGPDVNGWYNQALSVSFSGSDGASGVASCAGPQRYEGPDTVFAVVSGTCIDTAGNVGLGSLALKYDATAPQVSGASADREPDANGWYNHPLTVRFFGVDAISDIDACTVAAYEGPNNAGASVTGSCRDRAGNPSGTSAFPLKYDSTAPSVTKLTVQAGNRSVVLSWEASADTNVVEIARTAGTRGPRLTVYRGTGRTFTDTGLENGVRYRYTLTGYDEARNAASMEAVATPKAPLLSPKAGATVSAPPRLAWRPHENATYYNVQVWRRGRIFSAWPTRTSIQLKRTWMYKGRRYRLTPGRYRWYVWPGHGKRSQKDFGPLIGSSSFVVSR